MNLSLTESCRMGGDPFAVLKLLTLLRYYPKVLRRMGGDPFAVLKQGASLYHTPAGGGAAWGETLLRY